MSNTTNENNMVTPITTTDGKDWQYIEIEPTEYEVKIASPYFLKTHSIRILVKKNGEEIFQENVGINGLIEWVNIPIVYEKDL